MHSPLRHCRRFRDIVHCCFTSSLQPHLDLETLLFHIVASDELADSIFTAGVGGIYTLKFESFSRHLNLKSDRCSPISRWNLLPPCSGSQRTFGREDEENTFLRNFGKQVPDCDVPGYSSLHCLLGCDSSWYIGTNIRRHLLFPYS